MDDQVVRLKGTGNRLFGKGGDVNLEIGFGKCYGNFFGLREVDEGVGGVDG